MTVLSGQMMVGSPHNPSHLNPGQSAVFAVDTPHVYISGSGPCRAIVTVIYPRDSNEATPFDVDLPWPETSDDWTSVREVVGRACIEVQNGCTLVRITFRNRANTDVAAAESLRHKIQSFFPDQNTIQFAITSRPFLSIGVLHRPLALSPISFEEIRQDDDLRRVCHRLADLALRPKAVRDTAAETELLEMAAASHSITQATLAAEALTRHGMPTVPGVIRTKNKCDRPGVTLDRDRLFEDRIDVDSYEAFELVHPAYARQVLAVADALPRPKDDGDLRLLDVGTGPGVPLQMLLELRADLQAIAIDPSDVAFHYMSARFRNEPRVTSLQCSIFDYRLDGPEFAAAVSIGASHHMDTAQFFRSIHRCLAPDGVLIISDEMIGPFRLATERANALIIHHLQYISDTLVVMPGNANPADKELALLLYEGVPHALILAHAGLTGQASKSLRATLSEASKLPTPAILSHPLAAFSRFHLLELQALVAGLDYEIEQKTHPLRFKSLAESSGFTCEHHARIYATAGDGEFDAGTHLFVLKRL